MIDLRLHIAFLFLHLHRDWGGQSGMGWDGSLIYCMADGVGCDCFFFYLSFFLILHILRCRRDEWSFFLPSGFAGWGV